MKRTLTFEEGLEFLVDSIRNSTSIPFIASIIGQPNTGKSELIKLVNQILNPAGIFGWSAPTTLDRQAFQYLSVPKPRYVLLEDVGGYIGSDNCARQLFNKNPDLRIFIFRYPLELSFGLRDYNALIYNPNSQDKSNPFGARR